MPVPGSHLRPHSIASLHATDAGVVDGNRRGCSHKRHWPPSGESDAHSLPRLKQLRLQFEQPEPRIGQEPVRRRVHDAQSAQVHLRVLPARAGVTTGRHVVHIVDPEFEAGHGLLPDHGYEKFIIKSGQARRQILKWSGRLGATVGTGSEHGTRWSGPIGLRADENWPLAGRVGPGTPRTRIEVAKCRTQCRMEPFPVVALVQEARQAGCDVLGCPVGVQAHFFAFRGLDGACRLGVDMLRPLGGPWTGAGPAPPRTAPAQPRRSASLPG